MLLSKEVPQERRARAGKRPLILGNYAIYAEIASGGMATVHLGRALHGDGSREVVAIKRLRADLAMEPDFVTMFRDEARLTAHIAHENVARTLDVVAADGELLLVMEYVIGESLSRLTRTYAPPPFNVVSRVIADALHGLHAAHEACGEDGKKLHVVHRDVSPQNILVTVEGVAKLIDFGVAMAAGRMQHTRDGEVKGKLAYMPPEQLNGHPAIPQSDVYGAGVVLWEFLTGRRLFKGDNEGVVVTRILRGDFQRPKEIWASHAKHTLSMLAGKELDALDAITMRALALDPADRYPTAREMALDLERAMAPAPLAEVGEWVQNAARDPLASRAAAAAEIFSAAFERPTREAASVAPPSTTRAALLLPILVADLVGAAARDLLARVASVQGSVLVPLLSAPVDGGDHLLEVHVPEEDAPTLFYARAVGAPRTQGFPLALRPCGEPLHAAPWHGEEGVIAGQVEARSFTSQMLSQSHTRELTQTGLEELVEANALGSVIARGTLELEARIGSGGGGVVYRARHREFRSVVVAVKVLHGTAQRDIKFCERFHAEALAASRLDHVNLVRVLDFGQEPDGLLYYSMEHLQGPALRDLIEREKRVSPERAVGIMLQICAGLAHAHAHGVVHRDIKPSNVILVSKQDDDGRPIEVVKVCDFGVALHAEDEHTSAARVAGTPEYMSPEQSRGVDIDGRSDVYACGVVLYELVTGQLPFPRRGDGDLPALRPPVSPPRPSRFVPDLDPLLERVILKALEHDPANRHGSMLELRSALKELLTPALQPDVPRAAVSRVRASEVTALAAELTKDAPARMKTLAAARGDATVFARECKRLEPAALVLARKGQARPIMGVVSVLAAIAAESERTTLPTNATISAGDAARRVLHCIATPTVLMPIAERLLSAESGSGRDELSLLAWAEAAGAIALYHARTALASGTSCTRFVSAMRRLGRPAAPVLRAALQQYLPTTDAEIDDPLLAVDLLNAVARTPDDDTGVVVARYVRSSISGVACAALEALVFAWGDRARPLLLATLGASDEASVVAALSGLKALSGVDEFVMRRIETTIGEPLRSQLLALVEAWRSG